MKHDVYYRVLHRTGEAPCVVTMQWFDEYDYDQRDFATKERFSTEAEAQKYIDDLNELRRRFGAEDEADGRKG